VGTAADPAKSCQPEPSVGLVQPLDAHVPPSILNVVPVM
jgi:hypothetical protein